jgi:hypothetical protein
VEAGVIGGVDEGGVGGGGGTDPGAFGSLIVPVSQMPVNPRRTPLGATDRPTPESCAQILPPHARLP